MNNTLRARCPRAAKRPCGCPHGRWLSIGGCVYSLRCLRTRMRMAMLASASELTTSINIS